MTKKRAKKKFTDPFKQQMVQLHNSGKPRAEIIREYDLTPPSLDNWIRRINATTQQDGSRNNHTTDENVIEIPNAIPAIIDMDTWERVRLRINATKYTPGVYKAKEI